MRAVGFCLTLLMFAGSAYGQSIALQNLTQSDFDHVVSEFSANSMHTSVSGASSLGRIFGFELGVVGGLTNSPETNKLAQQAQSGSKVDRLPHGEILGALTVPFGLTVEAGYIPSVGSKDLKYNALNLAVKWTLTDVVLDLPLSLAVKGQLSQTQLKFKQTSTQPNVDFSYDGTVTGAWLQASKNLGIVEPYAGVGLFSGKGKMDVTGSTNVFNFTTSQSASSTRSTSALMLGAEVKLLVLKLGLEYARAFGTGGFNGKLSMYF